MKVKTQYMINLYTDLLYMVMRIIVFMIIATVLSQNFSSIIQWDFYDFMVFFFFVRLTSNIGFNFTTGNGLHKYYLSKGRFNLLLIRPGNIFFLWLFLHNRGSQFFYLIIGPSMLLPFVFLHKEFAIINFIQSSLISIYLGILMLIILITLDSFSWRFRGLGEEMKLQFENFQNFFSFYPSPFFNQMGGFIFLKYIPLFAVGDIVMSIFKGEKVQILSSILIIGIILLILVFIIYINWKHGLKKYEAFG